MDFKLDKLPSIPTKRMAVKVKPAAERAIRQQHPWIYEGAIVKQNVEGDAGSLAIIFSQKTNSLIGIGLYDPYSPIRIKLLAYEATGINEAWFAGKVAKAAKKRESLLKTDTNSYRLVYGENDGLPGLVADVYDQVLVIKIYSFIWLPYLKWLVRILSEESKCPTMVIRLSRSLQSRPESLCGLSDGMVLQGNLESPEVRFKEHGLYFMANVIKGHKTGYFLDHRHNRRKIGELANGKRVLDVFSYAGGFTVHALAGGATEVVSLDISAQAQKMAQDNVALNFEQASHQIMVADAFEGMQQLIREQQQFGVVVVDPPSFAKRESEREAALKSYERLAALAVQLVEKNGILLLASCSSRVSAGEFFDAVERVLKQSGRSFNLLERTYHDDDHPIGFPEGAYLKAAYFKF